jgi:hypothetical protein
MEEPKTLCRARSGERSLLFPEETSSTAQWRVSFPFKGSTLRRGYTFLSWVLSTEGPWTEATDESPGVARGLPRLSARCSPIRAGSEGPPTCRG